MKKTLLAIVLACAAVQAFGIADFAKFEFVKGMNLSRLESWTTTSAGYLGQNATYTGLKSSDYVFPSQLFFKYTIDIQQ